MPTKHHLSFFLHAFYNIETDARRHEYLCIATMSLVDFRSLDRDDIISGFNPRTEPRRGFSRPSVSIFGHGTNITVVPFIVASQTKPPRMVARFAAMRENAILQIVHGIRALRNTY
jgi:hypothetical protein